MKLSQQTKRKVAKQKVSMTYSHYDEDIDEEGWLLVGIFACVIGCWWGFIHLLDKFTFNFMPWYAEPFTIFPVEDTLLLLIFLERIHYIGGH